jgi:lambda repressor-like predicted transcriptional regulator
MPTAEAILIRMALVSYGAVAGYRTKTSGGDRPGPPLGEAKPMHDVWAERFQSAQSHDELSVLVEAAQAELDAWIRRPFAPDTTDTLEDLCARIVGDGWGVSADECARAMRCTPTLVRRARLAAGRHPDSGYTLPERDRDTLLWARALDRVGLSLRQIEALTGVPKSTLHDHLSRPRRAGRSGG